MRPFLLRATVLSSAIGPLAGGGSFLGARKPLRRPFQRSSGRQRAVRHAAAGASVQSILLPRLALDAPVRYPRRFLPPAGRTRRGSLAGHARDTIQQLDPPEKILTS